MEVMGKKKKRERNANFTHLETERLISLVDSKKQIIEDKKSDAVTWQRKEKAWKAIEIEFNKFGGSAFRNAKSLKLKYEGLKRDVRKKSSTNETNKSPPWTPAEKKVRDILLLTLEQNGSVCDSDNIDGVSEPDSVLETNNIQRINVDEPYFFNGTTDFKPKEVLCYDNIAENKLDFSTLQRRLMEEQLDEVILKKQILKEELKHKMELQQLEKQQMLLKIEILKTELENKKKES